MDNEAPLWLLHAPAEIFYCVFLVFDVDDLWRLSRVCVAWRELLTGDAFWTSYCVRMGWDYRAGLAEEAEKEEKIVAKARKNGVPPKRKSFIPFIGLGPLSVRFWARKHFFKLQRLRMYDESPAIEALRDPETRRAFGNNNRGFLDFVLAIDEHFAPALNKRALLSFDVGDYEAARKDLEVAVRFFPYFSDAVSNLGLALHELGHLEQAFRMYSIALSIEGDEISFNNRGLCLNDMGRNEEAINDFMTILTFLDCDYVDGFNNMAYSKNSLGRYEEAILDCTSALKLEPNLAEPHRIRAFAKFKLGMFREAVADATVACELFGGPVYAKALYTRGLALLGLAEGADFTPDEKEELKRAADADMRLAESTSPNVRNEL